MLTAIRRHLAMSAPFDAVRNQHRAQDKAAPPPTVGARGVERRATLTERFCGALEAVAGHCVVVRDKREAADVLREILERTKARRVAVSDSELAGSVIELAKPGAELLLNASGPALFECDAGVTSAQWGVAETGTLVLESDEERHRVASLVPPVHVAIIHASQVRETLGEVLQALHEKGRDRLSRTVTFITGPSRTSDIELTLAIGVHGPGELFVIIIEGQESKSASDALQDQATADPALLASR